MEMSCGSGPDHHVAQQSRRDKLRVQNSMAAAFSAASPSNHHHRRHIHHFDQLMVPSATVDHAAQPPLNHHYQVRNVRNGGLLYDLQTATATATATPIYPEEIISFSNNAHDVHHYQNDQICLLSGADPRWRSLASHCPASSRPKSPYFGHRCDLQASLLNPPPGQEDHRRYGEEMRLGSPPQLIYQNSTPLPSAVNSIAYDDELAILPSTAAGWTDQAAAPADQHGGGALALSLSSNPWSREMYGAPVTGAVPMGSLHHLQDSNKRLLKAPITSSNKASANGNAAVGPLGPFTGYATILKSSKFLRPAQNLLDEFCAMMASANREQRCRSNADGRDYSGDRASGLAGNDAGRMVDSERIIGKRASGGGGGGDGNANVSSSSSFLASSEQFCGEEVTVAAAGGGGEVGSSSSNSESCRPEYQQMKATLMFMQEEVCRRYRQYHQQMEMVVSSFESVAGLSAAAPYISLALKAVTRHFRCLKNAISNQLRHVRKALGEDLSSPTTGTSSSKGDVTMSRLKFIEQSFQKHRPGGVDAGFLEPQQHIWRPQRGLPERSVAILRAWLFDHFLHPYPTDTDKHMLANQTGLSRNQVSNWFINARVRVWKPMVEEIHMLESKSLAEGGLNSEKNMGNPVSEHPSHSNYDQSSNIKLGSVEAASDKRMESCGMGSSEGEGDVPNAEYYWNQEKRARLECQVPGSMTGSLIGFGAYERSGLENIPGMGAVSLTLGLQNNVDSSQQMQQQEHRLRQHFGGHMIHDFVG